MTTLTLHHLRRLWLLLSLAFLVPNFSFSATLDSFGLAANGPVYAVVEAHANGERSWIVTGAFTTLDGQPRAGLARLRSDMSLDPDFVFEVTGGSVRCVTNDAEGRILFGGTFTAVNGEARDRMARIIRSGSEWLLDEFDPKFNGGVRSMVVAPGGPIYVAGSFSTVGGVAQSRITKLDPITLTRDPSFDPRPSAELYAMVLQPDGKLLIGGEFTSLQPGGTGQPVFNRGRVARLDSAGNVDPGFNPNANSWVSNIVVQPNGAILLGGAFTTLQPNGAATATTRRRIARVETSGALDTSFDPGTAINNGNVDSVALAANGRMLIGGTFTVGGGSARNRLIELLPQGTVRPEFNHDVDNTVTALHLTIPPGGTAAVALVGGGFSQIDGQPRVRLARLSSLDGSGTSTSLDRLSADASTPGSLLWERSGYAPAFGSATVATWGGSTWNHPLSGSFQGSGWSFNSMQPGTLVRLVGRPMGGFHSSAHGLDRRISSYLINEGFHFPATSQLAGLGLWAEGSFTGTGGHTPITMAAGSLTYPALAIGTGNMAELATPNSLDARGSAEHPFLPLTLADGGELWMSFLLRVEEPLPSSTLSREVLALSPPSIAGETSRAKIYLTRSGAAAGKFKLGFTRGNGGTIMSVSQDLDAGKTHLVAARFRRTSSTTRTLTFWANPTPPTIGTGAIPDATVLSSISNAGILHEFSSIRLASVDLYSSVRLDSLRLGRSWPEVSPPAPVNTLAAWTIARGLDPATTPPLADLAGDGLTLTQKYAFNLNPHRSDNRALTDTMLDPSIPSSILAGLPVADVDDRKLLLYYLRPSPSASDLLVEPLFHTRLDQPEALWFPAGSQQIIETRGGYELVVAGDPYPPEQSPARRFARVRVTQQPPPAPHTLPLRWRDSFLGTTLPDNGGVELEYRPPPGWDGHLIVSISLDGETWTAIDPSEVYMEATVPASGYWRVVTRRPPAGQSYHFRVSHTENESSVTSNVLGPVFVPEEIPFPTIHLVSEWLLNDPYIIVGQPRMAELHITHPDGIDHVQLEIRREGSPGWEALGMMKTSGDEYKLEFSVAKKGVCYLRARIGYGAGPKEIIAESAIYGPVFVDLSGQANAGPVIIDLTAEPPMSDKLYEFGTEIEFRAAVEDDGAVKEVHVYAAGPKGVKSKPQPAGFPLRLRRSGDRERENKEGIDPEDFGIQAVDTSGNLYIGSTSLPALSVEQLVRLFFVVEATDFEGHASTRYNDDSWKLQVRPLSPLGNGTIRSPMPQVQLEPGTATLLEPGGYVTFPSSGWPTAEFADMTPLATDTGKIRVIYSDMVVGERIEIVRIADGCVVQSFGVPLKEGTVEFDAPLFYFRNEDYKPTLLTVPEERRIRDGGPLKQTFRNAYFLRLTDAVGLPVNVGPSSGRRDFRVGQPAFHWQNFTELDYGFYWYKDMHHGLKADPQPDRYQNTAYFDPTLPTVIYIHGWSPESSLAGFRENFHFRHAGGFRVTNGYAQTDIQNPESCVGHSCTGPWNLMKYWKQAGYNVGIFYWNSFSDEEAEGVPLGEKPYRAEAKLWTTTGTKRDGESVDPFEGMRYRVRIPNDLNAANPDMQFYDPYSEAQAYYPIQAGMNVSDLFRQEYAIAFAGMADTSPDKSVHLVGHSTGAGLVITGAFAVHRYLINNPGRVLPRPNRLTLLDAFLSENDKLIENNHRFPMRRARSMYRQMAGMENPQSGQYDPGIALEYVESSYIISHGASYDAKYMWDSASHVILKPDWIGIYGASIANPLYKQEAAIHMEAIRWYFMSKGFHSTRPRSGERGWFMWEDLKFHDYPAPSASISRSGILRYMPAGDRGSTKYELTGGNFSFRSTDDEFQSRSR